MGEVCVCVESHTLPMAPKGSREPQFEHCSEISFLVKSNQWTAGH